ncbi:MAG: PilZ domain-containing protein [Hyphomicrobiaceae bacterium]
MSKSSQASAIIVPIFSHGSEAIAIDSDEQRAAPRRRVLKGAQAAFNDRHCSIPCVVKNISATGARVSSDLVPDIPDTFDLIIDLDGLEARCEVVWRKDKEVGVRFVGAPRKSSPRRHQVVDALVPSSKPSLRKRQSDS